MAAAVLLPGEEVPTGLLPPSKKGTLTLGPGLRHIPPGTIQTTTLGALATDPRKSALWLETPSAGRYLPSTGDLVVAQVHHGSGDAFHCTLTPHTPAALLGHLAFEGANKKNRPQLKKGDLVYARVLRAVKGEDVEIECVNSSTGKAEGMGPLKEGMVFDVSSSFARRLMMGTDKEGKTRGGVVVLEKLGEKVRFEVAVGRNGRVWVNGEGVKQTIGVGRALVEVDEKGMGIESQEKLVKKVLKEVT